MKKLLSVIFTLVAFSSLYAQDTIRLRSGEIIPAQVQEIGISEIRYKQWSNLERPTYVQPKSNVLSISYKNGTRENFSTVSSQDQTNSSSSTDQSFIYVSNPNQYTLKYDSNSESFLSFGDNPLSSYEAELILGEDNYGTFMSGIRQRKATTWMAPAGAILSTSSMLLIIIEANKNIPYRSLSVASIGLATATVGLLMSIVGLAVSGSGNKRAKNVIKDYNSKIEYLKSSSPATLSLNLSPGLTLSF